MHTNSLIVFTVLIFILSGCVVNKTEDRSPHSAQKVYDTINHRNKTSQIDGLRAALSEQLARRSLTIPGAGAVPIVDPDIYIPVTILPKKIDSRSAARDRVVEWRLYKKGGLVIQ